MTGCVETEVKEVVFTASEYVFVVKFHHSTAINRHPLMHVVLSSRCLIITRHSLVERRARYLFYCMFVCLFGQRFLSNPRADSRQILHAGVALVGNVSSPLLGVSDPLGGKKRGNDMGVVSFVHRTATISVFLSDAKCSQIYRAQTCAHSGAEPSRSAKGFLQGGPKSSKKKSNFSPFRDFTSIYLRNY